MIISSLIRALIEETSVAINGLGTFHVKKYPSLIKDEIIYPPHNIIVFDYSKEIEGFDFVSKLSQWEQIRLDEAQAKITEWVDLLENGLNYNKSVLFDDFGTFSKNDAGEIVFQSVINFQLDFENEGLEPVIMYPKNVNKDKLEPVKDKRMVLAKKSRKRDKVWFVLTIVATLLLLCVLFLRNRLPECCQTIFSKKAPPVEAIDTLFTDVVVMTDEPEDVAVYNQEDETNVKPEETLSKITLSETKDIYLPYQEGKFYAIAGSFVKEEDALRHISQKKLEKYNAKLVVHPHSSRLRVCIGVFDNEPDAELFATQIDKNYWVLK
jgi:nucleoid DNA-binding protein